MIEAGSFPSGGCEYLKYYSLDLHNYKFTNCTEKLLPINNPQSPFDVFYMDIEQKYFFFPFEQKLDFSWEPSDDYILDSKFDTVGRALNKKVYYNGCGFSINENDKINYYFWQNDLGNMVCFPVNYNFEKQIYRTYYDILLDKEELKELDKFEIELLKNVILLKNGGVVKNEKIRNILSVYAFASEYKESLSNNDVEKFLEGNEELNYRLLEELN